MASFLIRLVDDGVERNDSDVCNRPGDDIRVHRSAKHLSFNPCASQSHFLTLYRHLPSVRGVEEFQRASRMLERWKAV